MCSYPNELTKIFDTQLPLPGASDECIDVFNLLQCWVCSPAQSSWYSSGILTICDTLCARLYNSCAYLSSKYTSAASMCQEMMFSVVHYDGSGACFNSAPAAAVLSRLLLVLLLALSVLTATVI